MGMAPAEGSDATINRWGDGESNHMDGNTLLVGGDGGDSNNSDGEL
jgi:hypothetical protein